MGRSAKLMKRPTKAEKLSRSTNDPSTSSRQRVGSLSPEIPSASTSTATATATRMPIPLFNTSAKRGGAMKRVLAMDGSDPMSLDSSLAPSPKGWGSDKEMLSAAGSDSGEGMEMDGGEGSRTATGKGKKSLKEKLKAAKEAMREEESKSRKKLGMGAGKVKGKGKEGGGGHISGGVDYLKLHESRPGGFKKRLR